MRVRIPASFQTVLVLVLATLAGLFTVVDLVRPPASHAEPAEPDVPAVWIVLAGEPGDAGTGALLKVAADNGTVLLELATESELEAVAVDAFRARAWTFGRRPSDNAGTLAARRFNGDVTLRSTFASKDAPAHLAAHDGTVWLALGNVLHRFDEDAVLRQTLPLAAPVHGLAADARSGELRAVTADAILTFDAGGELVDTLETDPAALPNPVALDGAHGLWTLDEERSRLLHVDAAGRVLRAFALPAPARALAFYPGRPLFRAAPPVKMTEPDPESPAAVLLAPADDLPVPASRPAVVFTETIPFDYTDGTTVLLASTEDGTGELLSDDVVRISVQNSGPAEEVLEHDFFDPATSTYEPLAPVDLSEHFRAGTNTVTIEILDTRAPTASTSAYYLVQPRDPFSRVLGGESPSVFALGGSVDLASGNYVRRETDITAPAPGLGVAFRRTYNSFDRSRGAFGFGWSSPYDSRATTYADGSVEVEMPSGRRAFFRADGSGGFLPEPGVFDQLEADGNGLVLTQKTTLVEFHYDDSGRLVEITESHGNAVQLLYAGGRPRALDDPAGRRYEITADSEGRVTAVTDPGGFTVSYEYDTNGDLVRYVDRRGGPWLYTYADHRLLTVTDPDGVVVVENVYAADGRLLATTDGGGQSFTVEVLDDGRTAFLDADGDVVMIVTADARFRVTALEDALGNVTTYDYNEADLLTRIEDSLGRVTTFEYDTNGNLVAFTDPTGARTDVSFNDLDRPDQIVDALGNVTNFSYDGVDVTGVDVAGVLDMAIEYDEQGNVTSISNSTGQSLTFTYDGAGNLTSSTDGESNTTTFTYDDLGRRTSATDANGNTTTFTYDGGGNLTSTTDPSGATESRTYDGQGRLTSFTDKLGSTWTWQYDGRGKLTRKTDAEGATTSLAYDDQGNLLSVTDPNGHVTRFEYNDNNWLERAIDAEGGVTVVVHDDQGRVTSFTDPEGGVLRLEYDGADRVSATIDQLGHRESFTYDSNGRRTAVTDKNGHTTTTTYDGAGQITRIVDALGGVTALTYNTGADLTSRTDPNGNTTTFVYDDAAQLMEIVDALGGTTLQEYSATGQVIRVTDPNGAVSNLVYDDNDRLIEATDAEGGVQRFVYDAAGNLTSVTDPNGHATTFEYDRVYRLTQVTDALGGMATLDYDPVGNLLQAIDPTGAATSFLYDRLDRLVRRTDALGNRTTFAYDRNGNRTSVTDALDRVTRFTYDRANRQVSIIDALGNTTALVRDPVGNLVESTNRVGDTLATAYDALNRVTQITDALDGVSSFEYDANGNVVRTTNAIGTTTNFVYDALHRLITRTDALGGVSTLDYDAVGNLTSVTNANGHVLAMAYDGRRRLVSRTDAVGGVTALNYDAAGNLIERTTPRGSTSRFVYDALNRVTQVTDALEGTAAFSYDARGALLDQTDANGHTTAFAYDALNRLTQVTDALEGVTSFTYDAVGNQLTRNDANGNTSSRIYDELDRVVERINALGDVTRQGYDALGRLTSRTDANGHTTGLAYDGLSRLARVIDPLGGETVYSYDAVSNLTGFTDANGNTISASYDLLNRQLGRTDPLGNTYAFAYDPVGNLIERIDGNGDVSTFSYDALNRRVGVEYPDRTGVTLTYDADGNLTGVVNEDENWFATYDALDRMTSVTTSEGSLGYGYDPVGNLLAATYPNGEAVAYGYDALNRQTSLTDPLGSVTSYDYDPVGNLARTSYGNGHVTDYVYDGANRLLDLLTTRSGDGALIYQNSLALDPVGNPLEIMERFKHGDEPTDYRTVHRIFEYDAYDRLIAEDSIPDWPSGTSVGRDYTYDAVGNVLREDIRRDGPGIRDRIFSDGFETGNLGGWQGQGQGPRPATEAISYAYDAANQLVQAGDQVFSYDGNGNRVAAVAGDLTEELYEYDFENRLTDYTRLVPQGQSGKLREDIVANYDYDGLGRRVGKTVKDNGRPKKNRYLYDRLTFNQLQESADPGHVTHLYRQGRELVASREVQSAGAGHVWYRQMNWRRDVAVMSNHDGGSVHHFFYTAYGDLLDNNLGLQDSSNFTGPHNHHTLTGKELDSESGLVYFGARYLKADSRQWMTRDPLQGFHFIDPRSFNTQLFNFNNALRFIDLDGARVTCSATPNDLIAERECMLGVTVSDASGQIAKLVEGAGVTLPTEMSSGEILDLFERLQEPTVLVPDSNLLQLCTISEGCKNLPVQVELWNMVMSEVVEGPLISLAEIDMRLESLKIRIETSGEAGDQIISSAMVSTLVAAQAYDNFFGMQVAFSGEESPFVAALRQFTESTPGNQNALGTAGAGEDEITFVISISESTNVPCGNFEGRTLFSEACFARGRISGGAEIPSTITVAHDVFSVDSSQALPDIDINREFAEGRDIKDDDVLKNLNQPFGVTGLLIHEFSHLFSNVSVKTSFFAVNCEVDGVGCGMIDFVFRGSEATGTESISVAEYNADVIANMVLNPSANQALTDFFFCDQLDICSSE